MPSNEGFNYYTYCISYQRSILSLFLLSVLFTQSLSTVKQCIPRHLLVANKGLSWYITIDYLDKFALVHLYALAITYHFNHVLVNIDVYQSHLDRRSVLG
jgi:hypothetical protein